MVRPLSVGIYENNNDKTPERKVLEIELKGNKPVFVIDGIALANFVLSSGDKEHSWDFAHGGDYNAYTAKIADYFKLLNNFDAESVIVLPLPAGSLPSNEKNNAAATTRYTEKLRRVTRVRQLLEKPNATSRNLAPVLPPFMAEEIVQAAAKLKLKVIFTRNEVTRFCANMVSTFKADAVIGDDVNYVFFPNARFIPIDSFFNDENKIWNCDYLTHETLSDVISLAKPEFLGDLNILLGNEFTENFVNQKYSVVNLLHIKVRANNPAATVEGIVDFINQDTYEGVENTAPFKQLIEKDPEFKAAIDECRKYYNLEDLAEEGESEIRKLVDSDSLPLWALGVSEKHDFWYEPVVDDYKSEILTSNITLPIRKIIYGILGRENVVEHIPKDEAIEEVKVDGEKDLPTLAQLGKMKKTNLERTFYNIVHGSFPKPPSYKEDPINKIDEPVKTIGLALRYLIAQCFTDNQTDYTKLPESNTSLKDAGVKGAPPLDLFELRALAAQALCLMMLPYNQFHAPEFKPTLRRMHVSALHQSVLQHMIWLQQVFGQKSEHIKPHRVFDGQIFAAAYDAEGKLSSEKFLPFYSEQDKVKDLETKRLDSFLKAVLYPFPDGLFEAFLSAPRSQKAAPKKVEEKLDVIETHKSAFANLMDDSEEDGEIEVPPAPVISAPPPPPPAASKPEKEKKPEMDEDEEMAFLMAAAAANKGAKREVKAAPQQKKNTPKSAPKKHIDKGSLNQFNNYNKESKLDAKKQMKQSSHDWHRGEMRL
ncbi:hypothetical protein TVAG_470410 [Trichomonas vaginalis G3]|uniref:Asteroid domain-containing protein n=1 Tax=Trichomonas vaginalis (strain ATCC PRA-98 / G3) TaxID=412133 RepID=A2EM86_TRIV3|nr:hypothetical protein TVAG_470410 [Trichomonas vaginalis G3]|eukprot:XP_001318421.1 hypothetical protein [Trichomonas vaginalis G3]